MDKRAVYKREGTLQYSSVKLTKEIAIALVQMVSEGRSISADSGKVHIHPKGRPIIEIPAQTLKTWIHRKNVVPETGEVLADILSQARLKRRETQNAILDRQILLKARKNLDQIMSIPDRVGARIIQRRFKRVGNTTLEVEKTVTDRGINTELLGVKSKASQFALERLSPESYGRKDKVEAKVGVFSLADLRKVSTQNEPNSTSQS